MAAIRGNFKDELDPAIRQIFLDRYSEEPQVMPEVFNVVSSTRDSETDSATTGFGMLIETSELGALDYEDPVKMYKTVYSHKKYTKGFKVSKELMEDDQHNVIARLPKLLAKSTVRTTEYFAASVLNNGFSTSYTSYGDGNPLLSTSHDRADGGTAQSNASSTGITLTETNLETGRLALEKVLDDKGQIVTFQADKLIIPVDLRKTAQILTQSTLRPGTANNDVNIFEGVFKIVPWRYLTSSTAWFLQDSSEHLLNFFWRVKPEFKSDYNFDADAALYKVRIRFSTGWSDWRGFWGSKGDGAAFSD
jgi:phage major head subunit gpT-like protein